MRLAAIVALFAWFVGLSAFLRAQGDEGERPACIAFVGARLLPIDADPLDDGVLVVRDGRIAAVGPRDKVSIPRDATRIDVAGRVIMPGLVCTHSHVGGPSGADRTSPIQPDCRAFDAINARDPGFAKARAGGLTTLNIMPGSGHLLSGQTVYVKLRDVETIDELAYRWDDGAPMGGMKMANGTNSIKRPPFPGTRAKSAALMRAILTKAKRYDERVTAAMGDPDKLPERDLGLEALVEVLSGRRVVHHHTHRHDDILTVLRLRDEFGFRVVLHHVSEAWKVADEIAAAEAPCSLILVDSPGGKLEAKDIEFKNGAELERRGVLTSLHTDDGITDSRMFRRMAGLAVRGGMTREGALRALTLSGAEMLDLGDRIGSLTVGKDADLCVLDGDPLSIYSRVQQTWVEGKLVFDLSRDEDRLYAEGGRGASDGQTIYMCCFQDWGN